MNIEIVAIGNEVLSGFTINTNAAFLSERLLDEGWKTSRHTVLPDDPASLRSGLNEALARNEIVIATGGLGPTCDDLTRAIAAELFDSDFRRDEEIIADLKKRYGEFFETINDQATVPVKAHVLKNSVGTAPGLVFSENGKILMLLPGVPPEMRAMWQNEALPYLKAHLPKQERYFFKRMNIFDMSESVVDKHLRQLQEQYFDVEFGIYPGQKVLGVHLMTKAKDSDTAMARLKVPYEYLLNQFRENFFDSASGKISESVHEYFLKNGLTLAAAESCTGGSVASALTKLPGASQYFLGSIVAYSNDMKIKLLDVPEKLIQEKGAVSEEVVAAMLQGLYSKTSCDYAIAVTGIAGPTGGTPEKPVGTVWCAAGKRGTSPKVWKFFARGNREMVIERSVNVVLAGLLGIVKV